MRSRSSSSSTASESCTVPILLLHQTKRKRIIIDLISSSDDDNDNSNDDSIALEAAISLGKIQEKKIKNEEQNTRPTFTPKNNISARSRTPTRWGPKSPLVQKRKALEQTLKQEEATVRDQKKRILVAESRGGKKARERELPLQHRLKSEEQSSSLSTPRHNRLKSEAQSSFTPQPSSFAPDQRVKSDQRSFTPRPSSFASDQRRNDRFKSERGATSSFSTPRPSSISYDQRGNNHPNEQQSRHPYKNQTPTPSSSSRAQYPSTLNEQRERNRRNSLTLHELRTNSNNTRNNISMQKSPTTRTSQLGSFKGLMTLPTKETKCPALDAFYWLVRKEKRYRLINLK